MILHSDWDGNDCIQKLRCHCIQIMHSDIYSVLLLIWSLLHYNTKHVLIFSWARIFHLKKPEKVTRFHSFESQQDSGEHTHISYWQQGLNKGQTYTRFFNQEFFKARCLLVGQAELLCPEKYCLAFLMGL